MLADRLAQIETTLAKAAVEQMAKAGENDKKHDLLNRVDGNSGVEVLEGVHVDGVCPVDGPRKRRKSVAVKTEHGNIMRHTQGHPSDVFEISEHLGDGERSHCWVGFHKETKVPVAIKVESKSDEVWLWEEVNILRKVEHPNVVKLFETFENDTQVFMVLELLEGGRLLDKVTKEYDPIAAVRSTRMLLQMALAVEHLHNRCICHRDIQPSNFLNIDDKPLSEAVVKLIDFTTAKRFGAEEPLMKTKICTPGYVAKEILTRKEVSYTEKIDIWSLGVVFFITISGTLPFSGPSDFEILKKVKKGAFKFEPEEIWATVGDSARDLISQMICPKVEDRLSARGVVEHPWFADS
jgi:calcium-dependent protein kinase